MRVVFIVLEQTTTRAHLRADSGRGGALGLCAGSCVGSSVAEAAALVL